MAACLGRGSWTLRGGTTPNYDLTTPQLGSAWIQKKDLSLDAEAVFYGVRAIQSALVFHGYDVAGVDGWFGAKTAAAVRAFKKANGRPDNARVGNLTARVLFARYVIEAAGTVMDPEILCGFVTKESSIDPGAVGCQTPNDLGVCQLNTDPKVHTISKAEAFNVPWSLDWTVKKFLESEIAYERLTFAPQISEETFAIARHNWPAGAASWARTGIAPVNQVNGESLADYVVAVRSACQ